MATDPVSDLFLTLTFSRICKVLKKINAFSSECHLFSPGCCSPPHLPVFSLSMGPALMPESCVFWQGARVDVDRRGNNNENTIKSRLSGRAQRAKEDKKNAGCALKI